MESSSFAGASGACPAPGGAFAPAIFLDPAPGGAFAPANFFDPAPGRAFAPARFVDPAPGGAFAPLKFLTPPPAGGGPAGAYPGPRNSLLLRQYFFRGPTPCLPKTKFEYYLFWHHSQFTFF